MALFASAVTIELAWLRVRRALRRAAAAKAQARFTPASEHEQATAVHNDDEDIELAEPVVERPAPSGEEYSEKPAPPKYEETAPAYSRVL